MSTISEVQLSEKMLKYLPFLASSAIFMQALDGTILNTSLPSIAKDLDKSPLEIQSIIIAYTLTVALLIPVSGWLSDKYGTKRVFQLAILIFTIGSGLCALSHSLPALVTSRIIQAIGGSMMVPVVRLAVLYSYSKKDLLRVMNSIMIPALIGPLLGPTVGGILVENLSWHWIFIINIPIGAMALWMTTFAIPDFKHQVFRFDGIGLLFFSGAITVFTVLMEFVNSSTVSTLTLVGLFAVTVVLVTAYVYHSKRISHPLIDLVLFKIRTLKVGIVGGLVTRLGIGGLPYLTPLLLQVVYNKSATTTGLLLIPPAIAGILAKSLAIKIVKKYGYRSTLIVNTILLGINIGVFYFINESTPVAYIGVLLAINGFLSSIQFTAMNTLSLADLDEDNSSEGNSLLSVTQQLSMSFGISVAAMILGIFRKASFIPDGNSIDAFKYSFLVLGIITVLSSYIFFELKKNDGSSMSGNS